jgi:hypothetical protein
MKQEAKMVKNIMVIDGADNCTYDCFSVSDEFFRIVFPAEGQDIEFIEDVLARHPSGALDEYFNEMWRSRVKNKWDINGIHGLLFYELQAKRPFYPNKRDADIFRP